MRPETDETITMCPEPCRLICGRNARVIATAPKKFVSNCSRSSRSETSSATPGKEKPALLISTSSRDSRAAIVDATAAICPAFVTSRARNSIRSRTSAVRAAVSNFSRRSRSRIVASTRHPRRASVTAVSSPNPLEAPVMRAVFAIAKPPRPSFIAGAWHTLCYGRRSSSLELDHSCCLEAAENLWPDSRRDCCILDSEVLSEIPPEARDGRLADYRSHRPIGEGSHRRSVAPLGRNHLQLLRRGIPLRHLHTPLSPGRRC